MDAQFFDSASTCKKAQKLVLTKICHLKVDESVVRKSIKSGVEFSAKRITVRLGASHFDME